MVCLWRSRNMVIRSRIQVSWSGSFKRFQSGKYQKYEFLRNHFRIGRKYLSNLGLHFHYQYSGRAQKRYWKFHTFLRSGFKRSNYFGLFKIYRRNKNHRFKKWWFRKTRIIFRMLFQHLKYYFPRKSMQTAWSSAKNSYRVRSKRPGKRSLRLDA